MNEHNKGIIQPLCNAWRRERVVDFLMKRYENYGEGEGSQVRTLCNAGKKTSYDVSQSVLSSSFGYCNFKKSIEVHFNKSTVFRLYFTTHMTSIYEKKIHQKCGFLMLNKYLYRISSFYEKKNRHS